MSYNVGEPGTFQNAQKVLKIVSSFVAEYSTSQWLYPGYSRRVAVDLRQQGCDVIHLQHCSQYAPIIHAHNPRAKIVLHLHAE